MPLVNVNWPGREWVDIDWDKVPQQIKDAYVLHWPIVAIKRDRDRIIIYFNPEYTEHPPTEVWQNLDNDWVHLGPRLRQ